MVRRLSLVLALVGMPSVAMSLVAARAQEPPIASAATRCGGLLCDLYYAGKPAPAPGQPEAPDPTRLPCRDFLCAAFGGRTPDPAPPVVEPAAAPAAVPARSVKRKRSVERKASSKTVAAAETAAGK